MNTLLLLIAALDLFVCMYVCIRDWITFQSHINPVSGGADDGHGCSLLQRTRVRRVEGGSADDFGYQFSPPRLLASSPTSMLTSSDDQARYLSIEHPSEQHLLLSSQALASR